MTETRTETITSNDGGTFSAAPDIATPGPLVAAAVGDVERVIDALQSTTIKGQRPKIRRFVD